MAGLEDASYRKPADFTCCNGTGRRRGDRKPTTSAPASSLRRLRLFSSSRSTFFSWDQACEAISCPSPRVSHKRSVALSAKRAVTKTVPGAFQRAEASSHCRQISTPRDRPPSANGRAPKSTGASYSSTSHVRRMVRFTDADTARSRSGDESAKSPKGKLGCRP